MKFKEYSFKSLLKEIIDNRGKTCPTDDVGIPLIATNCIKNDALYPVHEKVRYVNQATYESWFRGHPLPGDMIFVCKGSPGRVCWVPDPVNFCIAQDMVAIRADDTKVYPKYLFALLRSEETQQKILNMHVGTLIPHFKKGDFGNLYFNIPQDMEYQKIVGDAYFEFCKKIELNIQTNHTLESIAQAIFKSWFVDFEPIKAKIAAKERWYAMQPTSEPASPVCYADEAALPDLETYTNLAAMCAISGKNETELAQLQQQNPDHYQQLAETAALFPSAMVDSELGEIPEGWEIKQIEHILELAYGKSLGKTERIAGDIPVYGSGGLTGWHNKSLVGGPGIIVGRKGTVGSIYWEKNSFFPIDTVFYVAPKDGIPLIYTYYLLQTLGLENMNTDAAVPGLNRNNVYRLETVYSSAELIKAFSKLADSLRKTFDSLIEQSNQLIQIRDSLLPKLLSGEIPLEDYNESKLNRI